MDPIANMIVKIKNAQAVKRDHVLIPFSKMKWSIANVLKQQNFITEVERKNKKSKKVEHEYIDVTLSYDKSGYGAISGSRMISRPSRRIYIGAKDIKPIRSGYGLSIISTPKGILNSKEARKQNVGGEVLFEIW